MKLWLKATVVGFVLSFACTSHAYPEDTANVRVSALALLAGYVNVDGDWKIDDTITVGPSFTYWNWRGKDADNAGIRDEIKIVGIGVRGNYYPKGVFIDGWYASGFVQYNRLTVTAMTDSTSSSNVWAKASVTGIRPGVVGGYHWFWDNFNLNLGAGLETFIGKNTVRIVASDGSTRDVDTSIGVGLALDMMVGWTF
jgi:hypothetical protein